MLFRMIEILFGLFVGNNNEELRRTTAISSSPQNSRITSILIVPEQQICVWIHNCYSYSENNSYSAISDPSKHTRTIQTHPTPKNSKQSTQPTKPFFTFSFYI
jgi:hypothetical protein